MDPQNLPLLLLLTFVSTIDAQGFFPRPFCGSTGNFTADSTYLTTLTTLLSSISTTNSLSLTYGFFNASAAVSGTSQTLYVIGSCRGHLTAEGCRTCLNASASDIRRLCPLQKVAVLYSEGCTVRYSNASIFGTVVTDPVCELQNANEVSNQVTYKLGTQVEGLQGEAAGGGSLRKYATRNVSVGPDTIFAMAQCTPDLTRQQCIDCLEKVVGSITECCSGKAGLRSTAPSCEFQYEIYQFFNSVGEPLPPPPPPSPPPPPPPPPLPGKSNKSTVITIAITVPFGGVMVLLFFTCCLLRRKGKKTYGVVQGKSGANELTTVESLQFDLATIQAATNDFSPENKLGEGGFGEVFQGSLPDGQQIAVKRLSQSSRQGDEEFKNEVLLVAKLQHRNLV